MQFHQSMNYQKAQKVKLSDYFDEKWLQTRIEEDPSILGLPGDDLRVLRERRQSSGGRLDFLLHDVEVGTMYEVEIMLGATDASHIIRTIEYWDIESRKNPSKEHRAVIVAEEITNRFFNVIYLMNRSIPIIAIKLDALKLGDNLILHFSKVLDISEKPDDALDLEAESTDRASWEKWASKESMASADALTEFCKKLHPALKITYNESHIALGTQRQNFCWLNPHKKQAHCRVNLSVGASNIEHAKKLLVQAAIPFQTKEDSDLIFGINAKDFVDKGEILKQLFEFAIQEYS
jgi:hypothetical protein